MTKSKEITTPEKDYEKLLTIGSSYASWNNTAIITMILGITVNIDLHYAIGAVIVLLGLLTLFCALIINVLETEWRHKPRKIVQTRIAYFWTTRVLTFLIIPMMLWAVILMFQRISTSK